MRIELADFNGSDELLDGAYSHEWRHVEDTVTAMPLHLKASDQEEPCDAGANGFPNLIGRRDVISLRR